VMRKMSGMSGDDDEHPANNSARRVLLDVVWKTGSTGRLTE
jgi:hypothetical protein